MANPTARQCQNIDNFDQALNLYASVNCASSEDTRRRFYDNPLEVAEGCVNAGAFFNAVTVDVKTQPVDFRSTCTALHVRNTNTYVRALATSVNDLIDEAGTYAAYDSASNAAQNQRNRIKTFARHWIAQLANEIKTNYGRNYNFVNCLEDGMGEQFSVFCTTDAAMVFDSSNNRIYVLFANYPCSAIRQWLRNGGFSTVMTNSMWYRDLSDIDTNEKCVAFARDFATALNSAYNAAIANLRTKVRQLRQYIAR